MTRHRDSPVRNDADWISGELYASLAKREPPETIAEYLSTHPVIGADHEVAKLLERRTYRHRWRGRNSPYQSSMPEMWFEPVAPRRQIAIARQLFADILGASDDPRAAITPDERDPETMEGFVAFLGEWMGMTPGRSSFKHHRPERAVRRGTTGLGKKAFNKRFRFLNRFADHLDTYRRECRYVSWRIVGKSGLVEGIQRAEFDADIWSAAFVAYYASRCRRRSAFTFGQQERPFDDLCALLLERAKASETNWLLIARVLPDAKVIAQLDDRDVGRLLGEWLQLLRDLSEELERLWREGDIALDTMIVRRGNDSSRWNLAAQAYNRARTGWLAMQTGLGGDMMLDYFLPGKVLRLMAGDVAWGHSTFGGGLHPDTKVWGDLPFPWEVLRGTASCGRADIEAVCQRHGLDPVKSGWGAARVSTDAVDWRPTPELVHGVEVASPDFGRFLRKMGAFSGKPGRLHED